MRTLALAVATVTLSAGMAYGQSQCQSAEKPATCQASKTACATKSAEDKAAYLAALKEMGVPMMRIEVGDRETCCPMEAAELASKLETTPVYFVGDDRFDEMPKAMEAWKTQLDDHLATITTVQYSVDGKCVGCPMAASDLAKKSDSTVVYQVATHSYECKVTAGDRATVAKNAADKINMTYRVAEKDFCCNKMASAAQKETGEPVLYVVGEEVMECETQAGIMLSISKIQAAMAALDQADQTEA